MSELVYLINPPFGAIEHPSLGLGLLQASANRAGIWCHTFYANLDFAEQIGLDLYCWFSETGVPIDLLGEWVFSGMLFPENNDPTPGEYLKRIILGTYSEVSWNKMMPHRDLLSTLVEVRQLAQDFIEQSARKVLETSPRIVGCTSSFQQNCAALALLKRLRELDDAIVTLLGGSNCEGPMGLGLRRAFPWLDFVVSGEAELVFPEILWPILEHGRGVDEEMLPECVIGASRATVSGPTPKRRAVVSDLDATAPPNYRDYFEQLSRSTLAHAIHPGLLLETSRGCWWGQKHRCTFCGLNGDSLNYRAKSAERICREIEELSIRYDIPKVEFVDNNLDPRLVDEVFPRLANITKPLDLFFETRVINKRQLELMARGGVRWLQVGIESLHQSLLNLMGKGTSVLQNIQVLRWAYELGIRVNYNLIFGFPGENDEWYSEMSEIMPLLFHLEPPNLTTLRYNRFSVYFENPQLFGLRLAPCKAYRYVYSLPDEVIYEMAYFFEDTNQNQLGDDDRPGLEAVKRQWLEWRNAFWGLEPGSEQAFLHVLVSPKGQQKVVVDTRPCATEPVMVLTGLEDRIIEYCDRVRKFSQIETHLTKDGLAHPEAITPALEALCRRKVLLCFKENYLSLPVTLPKRDFPKVKDFPGGFYHPGLEFDHTPDLLF
jgi:ribosomal peptide maturation radical SAM protein 1